MIRRIGNKSKLADIIISHFPNDIRAFIDLFFGSGAISLKMVDKVKYIFANDIDKDISNLFFVLKNHKEELKEKIIATPYHSEIYDYWKKHNEEDKVYKAVRFLYLSNFGYLGKIGSLKFSFDNAKRILIDKIDSYFNFIKYIKFLCCDFREVLKKIDFVYKDKSKQKTFIYADPPYLNTTNNYSTKWTLQDTKDLFSILVNSGMRFAMSEFDNPIILELANSYNLNVIKIKERRTLGNRNTEILITNYTKGNALFLI